MLKKTIFLLIAIIMLFSVLTSCTDEPAEDTAHETTEKTAEEVVLRSFCARDAYWEQGYILLIPEEGSEEAEKWNRIYLSEFTDGTLCPMIQEKTMVKIVYSGEIEAMPPAPGHPENYTRGYIKNVHSITVRSEGREYNGINYNIAVFNSSGHNLDGTTEAKQVKKEGTAEYGLLLADSRSELIRLADTYFMKSEWSVTGIADEQSIEICERYNRQQRLLDEYGEEFFKENDLLMLLIESVYGSIRYNVTDIKVESGVCTLTVEDSVPRGTCDMEYWIIFISVPKEVTASVTEYRTYRPTPEWEKQD